jgi:transcriptional regulator with XRE-family HTH domain
LKAEKVAEYLSSLRMKTGLTYEAVAEKSNTSESTVKNLCTGKTEDPRIGTVAPIIYAMGGSIDEMLNPDKNKDEMKETSVVALKDSYEYQMQIVKDSYETQMNNVRSHYEQHHEDLKENYERRLSDKRELLETYKDQIKTLDKANKVKTIIIGLLAAIPIVLFIMEIMHPEHGWLRY